MAKSRITRGEIDAALVALNLTAGLSPDMASGDVYRYGEGGGWILGRYYVMGAYGGWQLVQVMNYAGGVRGISQGYATAREILAVIHTYRCGMAAGRLAVRG